MSYDRIIICPDCMGSGYPPTTVTVNMALCWTCVGHGHVTATIHPYIQYPPEAKDAVVGHPYRPRIDDK